MANKQEVQKETFENYTPPEVPSVPPTEWVSANGSILASSASTNPMTIENNGIAINTLGYIRSGQSNYNTGVGWWIGNQAGTSKLSIGDPSNRYLTWDGSSLVINGYAVNAGSILYGDGSDGSVIFDGSSIVLGITPNSNGYTLTRDIQCNFIKINSGVTIVTSGYVIYCTGTINNEGTIHNNGSNGGNGSAPTAGTAGVAGAGGTIQAGKDGKAGGAGATNAVGSNGTAGTNATGVGSTGVAGGTGGTGGANSGGTPGGNGTLTSENLSVEYPVRVTNSGTITGTTDGSGVLTLSTIKAYLTGSISGTSFGISAGSGSGSGGGSGGVGQTSGGGGGSGGTGGGVAIIASDIVNTGFIKSTGGNGGTGGDATGDFTFFGCGGGGGGGGGAGGIIVFIYATYTNTGTLSVAGGSGGSGGLGHNAGSNGSAGTAGNSGKIFRVKNN